MSAPQLSCRFCGCTEAEPCRLETNEDCILNVLSGVCSNPRCVVAKQELGHRLAAQRREHTAQLVKPIASRFLEAFRRRATRSKSKTKKNRRAL
jgi:hypothetical protein